MTDHQRRGRQGRRTATTSRSRNRRGRIPVRGGIQPGGFRAGKEKKGDEGMKAAKKFALTVKPIPEGYHSITPYLTVRGADRAIEFYRRAFGAEELFRLNGPDGKTVMHAELKIGDSRFFLGDEVPGMGCRSAETLGGSPTGIYLYVRDVDETFRNAVAAGATVKTPLEDMFWGDRTGSVLDPFGNTWDLASRREDVPPEEMKRRGTEFFKKMEGGKS